MSRLRKEDKLSYQKKLIINHPQFKLKPITGFDYTILWYKIGFECEGVKYKFNILTNELEANNEI